ncbi:MAG: hypothetical protein JWN04_4411 [Myxococcaceae bacterium]|nr:hypothetical protein [Myxococcaceae bacterium]
MLGNRRDWLRATLAGVGYLGLRTLATGLPAGFFLDPRRALAQAPTCSPSALQKAQYIIFNTCGSGDPINANVPGTYDDPGIVHSADPSMAMTPLRMRDQRSSAAKPWASLPQAVLDRSCFFHLMTNTPVHPKEPDVLKLMNRLSAGEMLPSALSKLLAPCLGTVQAQPVSVGASTPSEALSFGGQTLPAIPALALKATLTSANKAQTNLQKLRDQTLNQLSELYRNEATPAQRAYIDSLVTSQQQVRGIRQDLLEQLGSITDNSADSQVVAALTLIQMKLTPVVAVHIPFGGDNHRDIALADETSQTVSGVATIASLLSQLGTLGLTDQVTFVSLNVFGRTLGKDSADGRQHNQNHQASVVIGSGFKGGVIGGLTKLGADYGALPIDAATGKGSAMGDIAAIDSLSSFGKTLLAAIGTDAGTMETLVGNGKVITGALA